MVNDTVSHSKSDVVLSLANNAVRESIKNLIDVGSQEEALDATKYQGAVDWVKMGELRVAVGVFFLCYLHFEC